MASSDKRLSILDALRGIAALVVCWYHFTQHGVAGFLPEGAVKASGTYGWLGVQVFFVISGFIIPYTLHRSGYRIGDYGTFLLKRLIRLEPPYVASILIIIVLGYLSAATPGFRGPPFEISFMEVTLHVGYLTAIFGYPWFSSVFWTLAIEMQYYLLIGLLFFGVTHRSIVARASVFGFLAGLALLFPSILLAPMYIFFWLFLFMLGMAAFQLRMGILKRGQFLVWVALLGFGSWYVNGPLIAATGIATSLLVGLFKGGIKGPLLFFGHISYSLYLIHRPVGGRVINLGDRFVHTMPGKLAVLAAALAASIAAAWLLHRYVEVPAQKWSSRIHYRRKQIPAPELTPARTGSAPP